jgi:hypothetical protein
VLDPSQKTEHIRKYWGKDKLEDVLESVAETVSIRSLGLYLYQLNSCSLCQYKERYLEMHGNHPVPRQPQRTGKSALRRLGSLIRELSDDEGDNQPERHSPAVTGDLGDHWRKDFDGYLGLKDQLGEMTLVEWWGVRTFSYLPIVCFSDFRELVE